MSLHPRLTRDTVALVKRFETFQPDATPTPQGGWSIGYGHTLSARAGGRIGRADAEALLIFDLDRAARAVEHALFAPVTQRQFEALTALCFNLGEPAFLGSSALARTNAGAELDAADAFERWRQAELGAGMQVVDALVRRRAAEKAHFLGLPEGGSTWPSGRLRPLASPDEDTPEAVSEVECPTSAALTAANGVQARLRRLFPEDDAGPNTRAAPEPAASSITSPIMGEAPAAPDTALAANEPAFTITAAVEARPTADGRLEREVAWEPTPPPFDPAPSGAPLPTLDLSPAPAALSLDADVDQRPAERPDPAADRLGFVDPAPAAPRDGRWLSVLLGLVGAVMFVGAAVLILAGRPSLFELGIGIAGVVVAVPGLYGLLGAPSVPGPASRPVPLEDGALSSDRRPY